MKFTNLIILYSSGTGNTYRVVNWAKDAAEREGVKTKIIKIEETKESDISDNPDTLIGIAMPTHGFTAPWHMIKFAAKMPRVKNASSFCIATRAGIPIKSFVLPGLSGTATYLISLILFLKGYKSRGILCQNMPSNWMALHPSYSERGINTIKERSKPSVEKFIKKMVTGESSWIGINNIYELIAGLILLPISIVYLYVGRIGLAKIFFSTNRCNLCGNCAQNCPVNAIIIDKVNRLKPFWTHRCESCMRCMVFCPKKAIEASHLFVFILIYIGIIVASQQSILWLAKSIENFTAFYSTSLSMLVLNLLFLPLILILYYPFYWITQNLFLSRIFEYSTLTRLYKRYHEPETKLSELIFKKDE